MSRKTNRDPDPVGRSHGEVPSTSAAVIRSACIKISLNRRRTLYSGLSPGSSQEGLQRLLLLGTQTLGIAAEGPHLGPKGFSLVLGQLRLVLSSVFQAVTTSLNFLATWNRSVTARLALGAAPDKPAPCCPMGRTCWRCSCVSRSRHFTAVVSLPAPPQDLRPRRSLRSVINVT